MPRKTKTPALDPVIERTCMLVFRDSVLAAMGYHWPGDEPRELSPRAIDDMMDWAPEDENGMVTLTAEMFKTRPLNAEDSGHARGMEVLRDKVRAILKAHAQALAEAEAKETAG